MKNKEYKYLYPFSRTMLFEKLNDRNSVYHNWKQGQYLIEIKSDALFFLGVGRAGHSGGYWYVAHIEEAENGALTIRGEIVCNPDDSGNPEIQRKGTVGEQIVWSLLEILLFPLVIVSCFVRLIVKLVCILLRKENPWTTEKENLHRFMTEYLGCRKIR